MGRAGSWIGLWATTAAGTLAVATGAGAIDTPLGSGTGAAPASLAQALGPERQAAVDQARTLVASLRTGLASDSFERRILTAVGAGAPAAPALPAVTATQRRRVAALTPALRSPMARLLAAVQQARAMMGDLPAADFARDMATIARATVSSGKPPETIAWNPSGANDVAAALGARVNVPPPAIGSVSAAKLSAPSRHAAAESARAALLLGAALDDALPQLRAARAQRSASGAAGVVNGCDLLDETPILCVGSEADNHYTQDELLSVDLGGDDVYDTAAGATPVLVQGKDVPVSLNVDLAGDDLYRAQPIDPIGADVLPVAWMVHGQGAGLIGVGVLVDDQGDDHYEATAPVPTLDHTANSFAYAQASTYSGFGGLFDLAGNDTYNCEIPAWDSVGESTDQLQYATDACQVYGSLFVADDAPPTAALLVDRGQGDDSYTMTSHDARGPFALDRLNGQGIAAYGAIGILSDDGGRDAFSMASRATFETPDPQSTQGMADSFGQGAGVVGGTGALLEGDGPTDYTATAEVHGPEAAFVMAQGEAEDASGVVDDLSGNDHYLLSATRQEDADPACEEGACEDSYLNYWSEFVRGQGRAMVNPLGAGGVPSNFGALIDHGGDDSYRVTDGKHVAVTLDDQGPATAAPSTLDATILPVILGVQGFGPGGLLLDGGGTDDYSVDAERSLAAGVRATGGGPAGVAKATASCMVIDVPDWSPMPEIGGAQGTAGGVLADTGASAGAQHISFAMRTHLTTAPNTDGARNSECSYPAVGGAAQGVLWVPDGGSPTYVNITPVRPAHPLPDSYARGFGDWADPLTTVDNVPVWDLATNATITSVPGTSFGRVEAAPQPDVTALQLTDESAGRFDAQAPSIPAVARLSEMSGAKKALPGQTVHLMIQWQCNEVCNSGAAPDPMVTEPDRGWRNVWEIDAITDEHGVARAALPTEYLDLVRSSQWRLVAVFDGNAVAKGSLSPSSDVRFLNRPAAQQLGPP